MEELTKLLTARIDSLTFGKMESMFADEVRGTMLIGSYIWGKMGSQMRIVRVNSKVYNELMESGKRKDLSKLKNDELEVGGVYRMKGGQEHFFFGRFRKSHSFVEKVAQIQFTDADIKRLEKVR